MPRCTKYSYFLADPKRFFFDFFGFLNFFWDRPEKFLGGVLETGLQSSLRLPIRELLLSKNKQTFVKSSQASCWNHNRSLGVARVALFHHRIAIGCKKLRKVVKSCKKLEPIFREIRTDYRANRASMYGKFIFFS